MVVIEPIFTEAENTDFDIAAIVQNLHGATEPKLVLAYIDIGQAEEWRTYWEPGWEIGDPDWIVADDPDGWEGNFPVAYWRDEWQEIWLEEDGYLERLIDAGFDGVYLDWVEAYSDGNVVTAAVRDEVDPREEMVDFVGMIASQGRVKDKEFIVIAQNAAELATDDGYLETIDAIAQEQVWFDGGADNDPPGDCPLPRTEADVESEEYVESLSDECRRVYDEFPGSTLYVSSESYLEHLDYALGRGKTIFTVDYALEPENITWTYRTSRTHGFVPFVGERELAEYIEPPG
jgi:cysteinyl-tRNA synthetase